VKVGIEYIMELRHDAEVDGLRFTIPTSVAPRYGVAPSGLGSTVPVVEEGMKIWWRLVCRAILLWFRYATSSSLLIYISNYPLSHPPTQSPSP
jgi:hypothetical protein